MTITNIEEKEGKFVVSLKPNWLEKLFGAKPRIETYKSTWSSYVFGGGKIYIDEEGNQTSNGNYIAEAIDRWRRKQNF